MSKVGPVAGLTTRQFYNDETFWNGGWTEDELFQVGDAIGKYRPFLDAEEVFILSGDVWKDGSRTELTDFFRQWLATQKTTFVVAVEDDRRAELAQLLKLHGFDYQLGGNALAGGERETAVDSLGQVHAATPIDLTGTHAVSADAPLPTTALEELRTEARAIAAQHVYADLGGEGSDGYTGNVMNAVDAVCELLDARIRAANQPATK